MSIQICTVGGYNEVGENMTAIKIDDDVIICDMGLHLENYISLTEDEDVVNISAEQMIAHDAVPNISYIDDWKDKVRAIIPTHAHLDHVGAIPFVAPFYEAPIICTPFTGEVLKRILEDAKLPMDNEIKILNVNSAIKINEDITIEFVSITHSTPQTVMIVIHTKYGKIVYANDFKFDNYPVVGTKANFKRLKELGKHGDVLCLIMDSLYAGDHRKMPSESVAREMLKDVLLGTNSDGKAVIVTTFSSHIARLKSIVEFGKKMNRRIVFLGRSLAKYVQAAEDVGLINFEKDVEMVKYGSKVKPRLNKIMREGPGKYLIVTTGHQAEPNATLSKMVKGIFKFNPGDHVVFSSTTIPSPTNIKNRALMEDQLDRMKVRVFKDIHVSGHAAREDQRDLLEMLKPKHIIPAHGELEKTSKLVDLALEMGYEGSHVHLMKNGKRLELL